MLSMNVIDLVAPSSAGDVLLDKLKETVKYYEEKGFKVNFPEDMITSSYIYHANSDEYRTQHFAQVMKNNDSQIIWTVRGGYGSVKLIDHLQTLAMPTNKKILIGYSDITALHLFVNQKWGWKTIHGTGFYGANSDHAKKNVELVIDILQRQQQTISIPELELIANPPINAIEGVVTGGNLSLVQTSIGTSWQLDADDKILFLEDCNERGYKVNRMLFHLHQAGLLKKVKAIIYGDAIGGNEPDGQNYIQYALKSFAEQTKIPTFHTKYFGHGTYNYPFIIGGHGSIKQNEKNFVFQQQVNW